MAGPAYQWGHWRFEPTESRLLRDGVVVPLPAKTLDLLATLLNRAPRLVTKEEILAAVWADAVVEEGNIAFHAAALRKLLDEGSDVSAIETVRGRGYRFVQEFALHQLPPTEALRRDAVERAIAEAAASRTVPASPAGTHATPAPAPASPPLDRATRTWTTRAALALLALVVIGMMVVGWRQSRPEPWTIALDQFEIVDPPPGEENFPAGLRTYLRSKLEVSGAHTAERDVATAILSGQLHPKNGGFIVTVQLTRRADQQRVWDWSFEVAEDAEKPSTGQDDARSRLQGVISGVVADGVARYLNLSGSAPVTR